MRKQERTIGDNSTVNFFLAAFFARGYMQSSRKFAWTLIRKKEHVSQDKSVIFQNTHLNVTRTKHHELCNCNSPEKPR